VSVLHSTLLNPDTLRTKCVAPAGILLGWLASQRIDVRTPATESATPYVLFEGESRFPILGGHVAVGQFGPDEFSNQGVEPKFAAGDTVDLVSGESLEHQEVHVDAKTVAVPVSRCMGIESAPESDRPCQVARSLQPLSGEAAARHPDVQELRSSPDRVDPGSDMWAIGVRPIRESSESTSLEFS